MDKEKDDTYEELSKRLIGAGKSFRETNDELKSKFDKGISGKQFGDMRDKLLPDHKLSKAITDKKLKKEREEKKKEERKWTEANQKTADDTKIAVLINRGLFYIIPCPTKQLKEDELQKINLGGAIIATFQYYFPNLNLNHPVIVLSMRLILLFVAIKRLCFTLKEKIKEVINKEEVAEDVILH